MDAQTQGRAALRAYTTPGVPEPVRASLIKRAAKAERDGEAWATLFLDAVCSQGWKSGEAVYAARKKC